MARRKREQDEMPRGPKFKLPVNPELSPRAHYKAMSDAMIVCLHTRIDFMERLEYCWNHFPMRMMEFYAAHGAQYMPKLPPPQVVINVPSYREIPATQVPGVMNSPVPGHVAHQGPELRLVETIEEQRHE